MSGWKFAEVFRVTANFARCLTLTLALATLATTEASAVAPPTSHVPPIENCESLARLADIFAIDVLGYADRNDNGIPDYREFYRLGRTDCSSMSAEFDEILRLMGEAGVLNPDQAAGACQIRGVDHAANYVPWCGVVDVTPLSPHQVSRGHPWYDFPSGTTLIPDGYPDPRESMDPSYAGPFEPTTQLSVPPSTNPSTPGVSNPPGQNPPTLVPSQNPCSETSRRPCRRPLRRIWSR